VKGYEREVTSKEGSLNTSKMNQDSRIVASAYEVLTITLSIIILHLGSHLDNARSEWIYLLSTILFLREKKILLILLFLLFYTGYERENVYQITGWKVLMQKIPLSMGVDPHLKIKLLEPEFSTMFIKYIDSKETPRIAAESNKKFQDCSLYVGSQFSQNSELYFINYTMICDQMRSNTIYQIIKLLKHDQIQSRQGYCCDSMKCLQVLSDQIDCNHLMRNAVFSNKNIHKKWDLQELSPRQIIQFNPNLKGLLSPRHIIQFTPNLKGLYKEQNVGIHIDETIKDKNISLLDQSSDFTRKSIKFTLSDKQVSLFHRSDVVLRTCVISLWQYLMFFGLMLIYIILCWILLNLLIEIFALNFSSPSGRIQI
jgi:hypothetical protein